MKVYQLSALLAFRTNVFAIVTANSKKAAQEILRPVLSKAGFNPNDYLKHLKRVPLKKSGVALMKAYRA